MKAFLNQYKWIIIPFLLVLIVIPILIYFNLPQKTRPPSPQEDVYPTPFPISSQPIDAVSPIQKTTIGRTTESEVKNLPDLINTEEKSDGSKVFSFTSALNPRPHRVVTKNERVVFESILTPSDPNAQGFSNTSQYKQKYGDPEAILQGSKFYGWHMQVFVYASKGFSLIVNPNTEEVFEIHTFQPMSTENYIKYFGDDISPAAEPPIEK